MKVHGASSPTLSYQRPCDKTGISMTESQRPCVTKANAQRYALLWKRTIAEMSYKAWFEFITAAIYTNRQFDC